MSKEFVELQEIANARMLRIEELATELNKARDESAAMRGQLFECNNYLQCVIDQSMSRNNAEALAEELIDENEKAMRE